MTSKELAEFRRKVHCAAFGSSCTEDSDEAQYAIEFVEECLDSIEAMHTALVAVSKAWSDFEDNGDMSHAIREYVGPALK